MYDYRDQEAELIVRVVEDSNAWTTDWISSYKVGDWFKLKSNQNKQVPFFVVQLIRRKCGSLAFRHVSNGVEEIINPWADITLIDRADAPEEKQSVPEKAEAYEQTCTSIHLTKKWKKADLPDGAYLCRWANGNPASALYWHAGSFYFDPGHNRLVYPWVISEVMYGISAEKAELQNRLNDADKAPEQASPPVTKPSGPSDTDQYSLTAMWHRSALLDGEYICRFVGVKEEFRLYRHNETFYLDPEWKQIVTQWKIEEVLCQAEGPGPSTKTWMPEDQAILDVLWRCHALPDGEYVCRVEGKGEVTLYSNTGHFYSDAKGKHLASAMMVEKILRKVGPSKGVTPKQQTEPKPVPSTLADSLAAVAAALPSSILLAELERRCK